MELKRFIEEKFTYNQSINHELISHFSSLSVVPESCIKWMSHILNAHEIWNSRIQMRQSRSNVWNDRLVDDMLVENKRVHEETSDILQTYDLNMDIEYQSTSGKGYSSRISAILFHIINHSSYHRGQISSSLRLNNLEPIPSDYIYFHRSPR